MRGSFCLRVVGCCLRVESVVYWYLDWYLGIGLD